MWKKAAACVLSMVCGICAAKEVLVPLEAANDRDWTAADREAAQQILAAGDEKAREAFIKSVASGEAKYTFVQTVLPNIIECPRRSKTEPPRRLNREPGVEVDPVMVDCG